MSSLAQEAEAVLQTAVIAVNKFRSRHMRSRTALPLNDDILDRIMTFCTLGSLRGLILCSKAVHNIFQSRQDSIIRAVLYNVIGPAFPQALRALRYPVELYASSESDPAALAAACPEGEDMNNVTSEEINQLVEDKEEVFDVLEKAYEKMIQGGDPLTWDESFRLRRALYRYALYTSIFPGNWWEYNEDDDVAFERIRTQRRTLLDTYPTQELLELASVLKFLRHTLESSYESDYCESILPVGPEGVSSVVDSPGGLDNFMDMDIFEEGPDHPLLTGYFSIPLGLIWEDREVTPPQDNDQLMGKYILD